MKKLVCFLALISSIFFIDNVKALEIKKDDVANGTYIIGTYLFNREQNDIWDGTLKTEHIMLASRTIEIYNLENMKIYYKNARGKWQNPINDKELGADEVPTSFDIDYKNLIMNDLDFDSPNLNMSTLNDINQDDIVGCKANKNNTLTCHFDLKLNNDKILSDSKEVGYEIYSVDASGEEYKYNLLESKKVTNSNEIYKYSKIFNLGEKSTIVARAYVKNDDNEKVYSGYSNLISINIPKVKDLVSPDGATGGWQELENTEIRKIYNFIHADFYKNYDGIEVYRSNKEDGEYILDSTHLHGNIYNSETGPGILLASLNPNEAYYYKTRSYKIINGEKFYSEYSKIEYWNNIVPAIELENIGVNSVGPQPGENTYYIEINLSNSSSLYDNITFYGSTSENGQYHEIQSYTKKEVNDLKDNGFLIKLPLENYYYIKASFDNNGYSTIIDLRNQTIQAPEDLYYVYTQKSENGEYKVGSFSFDNMYDVDGGEVYASTSINGNYEKVGDMTDFYSVGLYYKFRSYIVIDGTEEKIYSKFTEPFYIDEKYIIEKPWLELVSEEDVEPYDGRTKITLQTNWASDDKTSVELYVHNVNGIGTAGFVTRVTDNTMTYIIPRGAEYEYRVRVCKDIDGITACGENSNTINIENNNVDILGSVGAYGSYGQDNEFELLYTTLMPDVNLYDGIEIWYSEDKKNYNLFEKIKKEDIDYLEDDSYEEDFNFIIGDKTPVGKTYYYMVRFYKEYAGETTYSKFSYVTHATHYYRTPLEDAWAAGISQEGVGYYFAYLNHDKVYDGIQIWYSEDSTNYNLFEEILAQDLYDMIPSDPEVNFMIGEKTPVGKTYSYKVRSFKETSQGRIYSGYSEPLIGSTDMYGEYLDTISQQVTYGGVTKDLSLVFSYEYENEENNAAYMTVLLDGKLVDFSSTNYKILTSSLRLSETEFIERIQNSINNVEITTITDVGNPNYGDEYLLIEYNSDNDEFGFERLIMIFDQDKLLEKFHKRIDCYGWINGESYQNLEFKNNAIYYFENRRSEILYEYKIITGQLVVREIPIPEDTAFTGGA